MKFTIYKNEVGQLMAMEGHCEFDGVVAKVFDLEGSVLEVHTQPETPLEHYWFNLGHQSNKISEENNHLREKLARYREALEFYASGKMFSSDPYCSVWEGWEYKNYDKRPIEAGQKAREALKGE